MRATEKLECLDRLPLKALSSAGDMLMLQFGEWHDRTNRKGETFQVGEWALHLQCPWRFLQDDRIILASQDYYHEADSSLRNQTDAETWSVYEVNVAALKQQCLEAPSEVVKLEHGYFGFFRLSFSSGLMLEVMPVQSTNTPDSESWRLLQAWNDTPHYVYPQVAIASE